MYFILIYHCSALCKNVVQHFPVTTETISVYGLRLILEKGLHFGQVSACTPVSHDELLCS